MIHVVNSPSLDTSLVYTISYILLRKLNIDRKTDITVMFAYLNDSENIERVNQGKTLGRISKLDSHTSMGERNNGRLIELDKSLDLEGVIRTLAHEMYHALQYQEHMDGINTVEERRKPYADRLYEIEAKRYERSIDVLDIMKVCYEHQNFKLGSKIRRLENKD
jgi:hypothetical protein